MIFNMIRSAITYRTPNIISTTLHILTGKKGIDTQFIFILFKNIYCADLVQLQFLYVQVDIKYIQHSEIPPKTPFYLCIIRV